MMNPLEIAKLRLHNQRLVGEPLERPEEVVRWLGAVQAQDYAGAKWGLSQRMAGVVDSEIDRAFNAGMILRTHMMRPTWHFVLPEDIRWILALTSPRVHAANAYYYRQLELDEAVFNRSRDLIAGELQGGQQRTRTELAAALQESGIHASGQRMAYILMHAELEVLICSGARRGKQFTYALLDERVPPSVPFDRDEALAELARRYFTSHGPATLRDFAWWSGLTVADAKTGLERLQHRFEHLNADGRTYWFAPPERPAKVKDPTIHFLPNYDEHLISYKDRYTTFDPAVPEDLDPEHSALMAHIILKNGLVIGGWRRTLGRNLVSIETDLLVELDQKQQVALEEAAEAYGRFLGWPVALE
jgi:hypothetical protein